MKKITLLLLTVFLAGSCARKPAVPFGMVTFYYGEIRIVKSGEKVKPRLKMILSSGDRIATSKESRLDLMIENVGLIRINGNSEVKVEKLLGEAAESMTGRLEKGQVLCKLLKLKKGQDFQVLTPTAVVGVRGTTFLVDAQEKKKSEVAVSEGSVEVSSAKEPEKKSVVRENETASVEKDEGVLGIVKGIKLDKLKELDAVRKIDVLKNISKVDVKSLKNLSLKNLKDLNISDLKGLGDEFKSLVPGRKERSATNAGTIGKIEETQKKVEEKKEEVEKKVEDLKEKKEKAEEDINKAKNQLKNLFK